MMPLNVAASLEPVFVFVFVCFLTRVRRQMERTRHLVTIIHLYELHSYKDFQVSEPQNFVLSNEYLVRDMAADMFS